MIDLTEAFDAAARVRCAQGNPGSDFDDLPAMAMHVFRDLVAPIVAAAAPVIERAVAGDLAGRLRDANDKLLDAAVAEGPPGHSWRLADKAEGVRLALSYVEEALR